MTSLSDIRIPRELEAIATPDHIFRKVEYPRRRVYVDCSTCVPSLCNLGVAQIQTDPRKVSVVESQVSRIKSNSRQQDCFSFAQKQIFSKKYFNLKKKFAYIHLYLSKKSLLRVFFNFLNSHTCFRMRSDSERDHEGEADTDVEQMRVLSATNPTSPRQTWRAQYALCPESVVELPTMELPRYRAIRSRGGQWRAVLPWVIL